MVDTSRETVFVTTGNNYSNPTAAAYLACIAEGGSDGACQSTEDYADSVLALNSKTGAVKWGKRLMQWTATTGTDDWNLACKSSPFTNCPVPAGPDFDFGSGPNEITYKTSKGSATIIGAGQKSGIYYALDPDTGAELWHTQVGPGIQWGSASDGTRIYVAVSNPAGVSYAGGKAGSWAALDPATGTILWQKPDPNGVTDIGPMATRQKRCCICTVHGSFGYRANHVRAQSRKWRQDLELPSGFLSERRRHNCQRHSILGLRIRSIGRFHQRQEILCLYGEREVTSIKADMLFAIQ